MKPCHDSPCLKGDSLYSLVFLLHLLCPNSRRPGVHVQHCLSPCMAAPPWACRSWEANPVCCALPPLATPAAYNTVRYATPTPT